MSFITPAINSGWIVIDDSGNIISGPYRTPMDAARKADELTEKENMRLLGISDFKWWQKKRKEHILKSNTRCSISDSQNLKTGTR